MPFSAHRKSLAIFFRRLLHFPMPLIIELASFQYFSFVKLPRLSICFPFLGFSDFLFMALSELFLVPFEARYRGSGGA
jgi:hypothetical protein